LQKSHDFSAASLESDNVSRISARAVLIAVEIQASWSRSDPAGWGRATSVTLQNTMERAAVLASAIIHSDPRSVDQYAGIRLVADTPL
jgi:hypothetical protein